MGARRSLPSREKSRFNETFDPSHGSVCYEKELLVTRVQSPQGRKKVFKRRIILEIIVKWDPWCSNVNGIVINSKHRDATGFSPMALVFTCPFTRIFRASPVWNCTNPPELYSHGRVFQRGGVPPLDDVPSSARRLWDPGPWVGPST